MTTATTSINFAGASSIYASRMSSLGLMSGWSNVSADAASSGMRRIKAIQTIPNPILEPKRVTIKGDNVRQTTYLFANDGDATGNLELGNSDADLENTAIGTTAWTLGNWKQTIRGIASPNFANIMLLVHSQATSQDAATLGQTGFMNVLYPNCQLLPLGHENQAYQAEGKFRFAITVNPISQHPLGLSLLLANFGVSNGLSIEWFSTYPTMFHCKIGDGTWTTITTDGVPVDTASTKVYKTVSGTTTTASTVSSVTPASNLITVSAAPASASVNIAMYESSTTP